ncbi:MAG: DUF1049 domain-containing protein [Candidatus Anaerobiospirillum merdipullorum]|uniref:DUF1049 domain-containing protein n=1 Tax=Candidatus Anaerobiospirillum merdipullorum TaxID=2838450 RepID=A0A9E2KPR8_9GAMM|nr:DUF1049 domain-containing protein [Candidatus Anaerobiospirillum merdipullorum]
MLKFLLYILVLIVIAVLGLTIGSANETVVAFDFLFVKANLSLGMVLVIGIICGIVIGLYIASLFCLKVWFKAHGSRVEVKRLRRQEQQRQLTASPAAETGAANQ